MLSISLYIWYITLLVIKGGYAESDILPFNFNSLIFMSSLKKTYRNSLYHGLKIRGFRLLGHGILVNIIFGENLKLKTLSNLWLPNHSFFNLVVFQLLVVKLSWCFMILEINHLTSKVSFGGALALSSSPRSPHTILLKIENLLRRIHEGHYKNIGGKQTKCVI